jgi:hypothetical protein
MGYQRAALFRDSMEPGSVNDLVFERQGPHAMRPLDVVPEIIKGPGAT